jgi:hypothetical protein
MRAVLVSYLGLALLLGACASSPEAGGSGGAEPIPSSEVFASLYIAERDEARLLRLARRLLEEDGFRVQEGFVQDSHILKRVFSPSQPQPRLWGERTQVHTLTDPKTELLHRLLGIRKVRERHVRDHFSLTFKRQGNGHLLEAPLHYRQRETEEGKEPDWSDTTTLVRHGWEQDLARRIRELLRAHDQGSIHPSSQPKPNAP